MWNNIRPREYYDVIRVAFQHRSRETMTKTLPDTAPAVARSHPYRADIDGLRAVAVLAVVVFHAFPAALPGGFVGVDIFLVISGYLITGILLGDLWADQFSVSRFYARRARRIFPALLTVLLATWAIGWSCLTSDEYKELGKHVLAGAGFLSNWALWTEAGYFDQTASAKPLLHLWSLGVEEQFYIVWPFLLLVAFKARRVALFCAAVGLASFMCNLWLTQYHPSAAFYWPMSRIWELAAGAGLAISREHVVTTRRTPATENALSLAGFLLCVVSFSALNSKLAFPGGWAILPVLGAVALISADPDSLVNRYVLSNRVAVWFGKISYALYLWHWPLLSFAFIMAGDEPSSTVRTGIVVISIGLAWLTTISIEQPVRLGPPARWKLIVPCVLMLGIAYLGGMTYARGGLGFRKGYSPDADAGTATLGAGHEFVNPACGISSADQRLFPFCATDRRSPSHFVVWGDSKADALYWGLVRKSLPGMSWTLIGRPSCAPMVGVSRISSHVGDDPQMCREANDKALHMLLNNPALTTVVLVMSDRDVVDAQFAADGASEVDSSSAAVEGLDKAVTQLQRAGKHVSLVLDNPRLRDPRQCMDRRPLEWPVVRRALGVTNLGAAKRCAISYSSHVQSTAAYRAIVGQLEKHHPRMQVYDPAAVLCDIRGNICPMTMNGHYLYSYGDHMSDYANGLAAAQLLPILAR
ncbi:acyltransferase family protein [Paraburkholderia sp. BCC1885]|uniref:acyltransferase family protein n=1 Tax=Paraburkholderia sp. BCC1885 TaxID=2562669 RepID=UPI0021B4953A|nr:acyltransferase family protein [Paraburkholderia sp. BCC1885]